MTIYTPSEKHHCVVPSSRVNERVQASFITAAAPKNPPQKVEILKFR